ncbi:MAG TPA: shikimate kinase [Thiobacillaceae bacterium]|nr:shikimate kinase [Thiobacillaceae bacterium]HNA82177.1 shikimate kinase [Thiobacillaceae bacterium]HNF89097.1 shikimate kinase [Thiobacillaceae bacterium]HNH89272.1 shikimate kinase [Thiobacillaceae bacterium]HNI07334.1 shikimate kinase [Thiobacillaceae bacterium]
MIPSCNIFLVGLMGAGKTTIGKLLAKQRGLEFIDSDQEIVARCGVSIPTIFEIEGEAGFRKREAAMIDELSQRRGIVLATGGGAVLMEENRTHLKARGTVVYLRCQPQELYLRTRHDKNRPLLQTADPLAKLRELYGIRHPLYMQAADIVLESGRQSSQSLVQRLENNLNLAAIGKGDPCVAAPPA